MGNLSVQPGFSYQLAQVNAPALSPGNFAGAGGSLQPIVNAVNTALGTNSLSIVAGGLVVVGATGVMWNAAELLRFHEGLRRGDYSTEDLVAFTRRVNSSGGGFGGTIMRMDNPELDALLRPESPLPVPTVAQLHSQLGLGAVFQQPGAVQTPRQPASVASSLSPAQQQRIVIKASEAVSEKLQPAIRDYQTRLNQLQQRASALINAGVEIPGIRTAYAAAQINMAAVFHNSSRLPVLLGAQALFIAQPSLKKIVVGKEVFTPAALRKDIADVNNKLTNAASSFVNQVSVLENLLKPSRTGMQLPSQSAVSSSKPIDQPISDVTFTLPEQLVNLFTQGSGKFFDREIAWEFNSNRLNEQNGFSKPPSQFTLFPKAVTGNEANSSQPFPSPDADRETIQLPHTGASKPQKNPFPAGGTDFDSVRRQGIVMTSEAEQASRSLSATELQNIKDRIASLRRSTAHLANIERIVRPYIEETKSNPYAAVNSFNASVEQAKVPAAKWPPGTSPQTRVDRLNSSEWDRLTAEPIRNPQGKEIYANFSDYLSRSGLAQKLGVDFVGEADSDKAARTAMGQIISAMATKDKKPEWLAQVPAQVRDMAAIVSNSRSDGTLVTLYADPAFMIRSLSAKDAGLTRAPHQRGDVVGLLSYAPLSPGGNSKRTPTSDTDVIIGFKNSSPQAVKTVADSIQANLPVATAVERGIVFVPVPSSTPGKSSGNSSLMQELKKRGYSVDTSLLKNPFTREKTSASPAADRSVERQQNSLVLARKIDSTKNYVLFDDVLTSGTSIASAMQLLQQNGAGEILPMVAGITSRHEGAYEDARTAHRRLEPWIRNSSTLGELMSGDLQSFNDWLAAQRAAIDKQISDLEERR